MQTGELLDVAAPGRLSNAQAPAGAVLSAVLVSPPLNGVVQVDANGAFAGVVSHAGVFSAGRPLHWP